MEISKTPEDLSMYDTFDKPKSRLSNYNYSSQNTLHKTTKGPPQNSNSTSGLVPKAHNINSKVLKPVLKKTTKIID